MLKKNFQTKNLIDKVVKKVSTFVISNIWQGGNGFYFKCRPNGPLKQYNILPLRLRTNWMFDTENVEGTNSLEEQETAIQ